MEHAIDMPVMGTPLDRSVDRGMERAASSGVVLRESVTYEHVYEKNFDFVWRNARRLGLSDAVVDDVVQDVFIVVHRRLGEFQARSSIRTWLFGILLKVAKDQRRGERRRLAREQVSVEIASIESEPLASSPADALAKKQAAAIVAHLLESLDDDKRAIFVSVELEQMSVAEAAEAMGINPNTAHARLRAARQLFQQAVARHHAASRFSTSTKGGQHE
jgi:RNA polymerase sigma-70 factor (ECF subfamily)